ncbi:4'-phosphopantetheinyl transferase superfamily protein [Streptomyces sp. NPDC050738]|uniref:4'-phosphopantetheinyl transferase family protein n=1 Tax=Streptomyces sp. NPDC050738 TaxID=3154744 RepID=UPI00343F9AEA
MSDVLPLDGGRVDLWLLRQPRTGTPQAEFDRSVLDEAERHRAGTCKRSTGGHLYALAHIALRRLLGEYLDTPAAELEFMREPCPGCGEPHGRPAVADPPRPVHFSLSHSSGMVLVGVAATPIGVDVEVRPGAETVEVCSAALHTDERTELRAEPDHVRQEAFGRLWTRKEAYLKGIGTGLSRDLSADYLGADRAAHPEGWTLLDIPCGPRHSAAAAVRGPAPAPAVRWLSLDWLRDCEKRDALVGASSEGA